QLWPDGSIDLGGQQTQDFIDPYYDTPYSNETALGMAIQADGKIVTVGDVSRPDASAHDFSVARFLADGQPDGAFGGSLTDPGRVVFGNNGSDETAGGVAIQPDGKIVVAGHSITGRTADFMVARFNANGTPDASFGFGGSNVIDFLGDTDY